VDILNAAAEVDRGFGDYWMAKASKASDREEQASDRDQGCRAYRAVVKLRSQFAGAFRISPSEYPISDPISSAELKQRCEIVGSPLSLK
jgi:hypothetical protein